MCRKSFKTVLVECSICNGTGRITGLDRRLRPHYGISEGRAERGCRPGERLVAPRAAAMETTALVEESVELELVGNNG